MKQSRLDSVVTTVAAVLTVLAVLMAAVAHTASAQQAAPTTVKIGFVNTERVMREARAPQQTQKNLEAEFQKRDREIAAGPPADMERRRFALGEEFNQRRDEALKQIIDKANAMIRRVAEQEKIDVVFVEAAYANARIDITEQVIKALDGER